MGMFSFSYALSGLILFGSTNPGLTPPGFILPPLRGSHFFCAIPLAYARDLDSFAPPPLCFYQGFDTVSYASGFILAPLRGFAEILFQNCADVALSYPRWFHGLP